MTTIAFDGRTMACDGRWSTPDGTLLFQRTKIMRLPSGALYGSAGSSDDRELIDLLKKVKHPHQMPTLAQLGAIRQSLDGLFVLPSGKIFLVETQVLLPGTADEEGSANECGVTEAHSPIAVGSGNTAALAAMRAGASAYDAVKIAVDLDRNSGPPVYRLALNPKATPPARR